MIGILSQQPALVTRVCVPPGLPWPRSSPLHLALRNDCVRIRAGRGTRLVILVESDGDASVEAGDAACTGIRESRLSVDLEAIGRGLQ